VGALSTVLSPAPVIPIVSGRMPAAGIVRIVALAGVVAVAGVDIPIVVHGVPIPPSIIPHQGGGSALLYHPRHEPPQDDADPALAILVSLAQGVDAVLPLDVLR
jgi:hypothetical protein